MSFGISSYFWRGVFFCDAVDFVGLEFDFELLITLGVGKSFGGIVFGNEAKGRIEGFTALDIPLAISNDRG